MCTGAEIPALMALSEAGAAGAAGAGTAAAGTAAAGAGAGAAAAGLGAGAGLGALGTGAMDMAGAAGTGLLGDAAGSAAVGAGATGAMDMGGMLGTGIPGSADASSVQFSNLLARLGSKFDTTKMGARLMSQALQPQTPQVIQAQRMQGGQQQSPMGPSAPFAANQPAGQPMSPGGFGSMMNKPVQATGGQADILKRLGLLGMAGNG